MSMLFRLNYNRNVNKKAEIPKSGISAIIKANALSFNRAC